MSCFYSIMRMPAVGVCMLAALSAYSENVQVGDLFYSLNEENATATLARNGAYTSMTSVDIPGKINVDGTEYTVTAVAQQAFQQCKSLEKLTIGEGIESIGKWAFYECSALTDVSLPSTLTNVMSSAFSKCYALPVLVLPANLTTVGSYAFGTCTSLTEVTFPAEMTTLGGYAFSGCSALSKINFNAKLDSIGENAFTGCGMKKVVLPQSLRAIGDGAFSNSLKLEEIEFPAGLQTIGNTVFYKCAALSGVTFPSGLKSIGMGAFYECTSLSYINFSENISFIDSNCFYGCSALKSVEIPTSITSVSSGMFYNCTSLTDVKLHNGITELGKSVFYSCTSLASVDLPAGLTTISNSLFNRCSALTEITIPENVTMIDENAFRECTSLTKLFIPKNVEVIGDVMVLGCTSLKDIEVDTENRFFTSVDGVVLSKDETVLVAYPAGRTDVYVMPESVTDISGYVFNSNPNISGIVLSKNLKRIGTSAFYSCPGITEIEFPESLESIGDLAFFINMGLKSVKLPNRDITIGNNAFSLTGLSELVFPENITTIGISGESGVSIMGMCSAMKWVSLPSTLTAMSPIGASCGSLATVYSFAAEPPALVGENVVNLSAVVKVPKGSAEAYAEAWKTLYPDLTYEDVLPAAPEVTINGTSATVAWEAYGDDIYTGTPVRYELTLSEGGTAVASDVIEGDNVGAGAMSHTFENLTTGSVYTYEIKGYSSIGQLTMLHRGEINMSSSGIDGNIVSASEAVSTLYYDLSGRMVETPVASALYIVRTTYADGSVKTEKRIVKKD